MNICMWRMCPASNPAYKSSSLYRDEKAQGDVTARRNYSWKLHKKGKCNGTSEIRAHSLLFSQAISGAVSWPIGHGGPEKLFRNFKRKINKQNFKRLWCNTQFSYCSFILKRKFHSWHQKAHTTANLIKSKATFLL